MKFDYLREFVAAAQSEEMQHCAKDFGISPSVLSKHIKALEQELGVPLFMRSRKTELSPYGRILLPYAQELIKVQDDYLLDFSQEGQALHPQLSVGISSIQFRERSGQLLENFILRHPQEILLREADNSALCQMLIDGEIDIAFIRTQPELHRNPELVYFPFCSDPMVAFLPLEHPLAKSQRITIEELKNEQILLRSENSTVNRVYREKCAEHGFDPMISYHSAYVNYDMVRRGEGITLYLAPPADTNRNQHQLAIVPIVPHIVSFVDVVFRPRQLPALGLELLQFVQQSAIEWYRSTDVDPLSPT